MPLVPHAGRLARPTSSDEPDDSAVIRLARVARSTRIARRRSRRGRGHGCVMPAARHGRANSPDGRRRRTARKTRCPARIW